MSSEQRLKALMEKGWNIHIECKGKGREYELSYEAHVKKVSDNPIESLYTQAFAVGNTLEELIDSLEEKLKDKE